MNPKLSAHCLAHGLVFAMAALSASASFAQPDPERVAKRPDQALSAARATATRVPAEEMVAGFIVKPRQRYGAKLRGALEARDATALAHAADVALTVARPMSGGAHVVRLEQAVSLSEARAIAARMMQAEDVELVEPDRIMHPANVTPTDPAYAGAPTQWHYMTPSGGNRGGANLPAAWASTLGEATVNVAVLDTGYRPHADLGPVLDGYDFVSNSAWASDGNGRDADAIDPGDWNAYGECGDGISASDSSWHGSHVTGTIAALMNNGIGGTGIAPGSRILPLRVLGKCGGTTSDIVDAMRWAAGIAVPGAPVNRNVAQILNLSLGGAGACSAAFQSAVNDVVNAGKVVVVAAGNDGSTTVSQPANCSGVIAVTAHTVDGDNASYANVGAEVAVSAPGGGCGTMATSCAAGVSANGLGVYSTGNAGITTPGADAYAVRVGTSMATPHVSGVIALMLSMNPAMTPAEVKSTLRASARSHPPSSYCGAAEHQALCGAGLLDADAALTMVVPAVSVTPSSQVVAASSLVSLAGTASAPTGRSIVSQGWTQAPGNPSVVTLSDATSSTVSFTAPLTGSYVFVFSATDSAGKTSTANAAVRVNTAPALSAVNSQRVKAGDTLRFRVAAVDPDGDTPIFHALSLPPGARLSASGEFHWPSAIPVGDYALKYYASDSHAKSAPATVTITVTPSSGGGGGGGGGSVDGGSLIGLSLLAVALRWRRSGAKRAAGNEEK